MTIYGNKSISSVFNCAILWYPSEFHADLLFNGTVYDLCLDSQKSEERRMASSLSGNGKEFYIFRLALSKEESNKMENILKPPFCGRIYLLNTCSGHIASLVSLITDFAIPAIESITPHGLANYLDITKEMQGSRLFEIKHIGKRPKPSLRDDIKCAKLQLISIPLVAALVAIILHLACRLGFIARP